MVSKMATLATVALLATHATAVDAHKRVLLDTVKTITLKKGKVRSHYTPFSVLPADDMLSSMCKSARRLQPTPPPFWGIHDACSDRLPCASISDPPADDDRPPVVGCAAAELRRRQR